MRLPWHVHEGFCIIEVLFDAKGRAEDYRFLEVNEAFERQTGLHNVQGKRMRELAPAHEEYWFEIYGRIALTGEAMHFMDEAAALNRWYDVHAYRVGEPEMRRVAIVFNDFSDYKRAEEALQKSEAEFRTLANAIPQLCWTANADGWITWYNRRWYEYTGTTREQMEGWGWQSVHDPEVLPRVLERWAVSIASGSPFEMVFPLRGADGVFRPFLTRVMPLKDSEGNVMRWFGTNTDISEQKQIEAELRRNQTRLNIALEVAHLGEWERDLKTQVASRSLRHAQIFGYTSNESEWNFETFLSHILPQYRDKVTEWYKSSLAGGTWDFETRIRRADGEVRWVWFRSHTRLDEAGRRHMHTALCRTSRSANWWRSGCRG
jgi:PAS domain S-box-containing protein